MSGFDQFQNCVCSMRIGPFVLKRPRDPDEEMFSERYNLVPVWRIGKLRIVYRPIRTRS